MTGRRFATLAPVEALQAAIAVERRNTGLYRNLAGLFASYDGEAARIFAAMAEEETQHRLELEAFLREHFPGERPTASDDPGLEEPVEAPDLEEPEAFVFDNVGLEQALEMADQAEARACAFYHAMAEGATDGELRDFCRHMAEVEAGHRQALSRLKRS